MASLTTIKEKLDHNLYKIDKTMKEFPWTSAEKYGFWLSQTYYYVCHSTRLLCLAGARFSQQDNRFHLRGIEHMKEEKSHEKLALMDLHGLNRRIDSFSEMPVTQALYQTVY